MPRRRGEKNFSDLFGTDMGQRREVRNREEVIGSNNCSFLDAKGEIAVRNQGHWRPEQESAATRRQQQTCSHVFEGERPQRPDMEPEMERVLRQEGACWEVANTMQTSSEIARRRRMKDHFRDFEDTEGTTHFTRKQELLDSAQVRANMGSAGVSTSPQCANRAMGSPVSNTRGTPSRSPHSTPPWATDSGHSNAQGRKLASLQSSIFS